MKKTLLILFSLAGIFAQAQTLSMPTIPSAGVTYSVTIKSDTVPHPTQGNWDFSNVTATDINTMTTVELDAYLDSFNQPVTAPTADATGGMTLLSPEQAEEAGLVGGQRGKSLVIERISNSLFNLVLRSTMK